MSENTVTATYTTLVADVRKLDTALLITNGADSYPEDSFADLYWTGGAAGEGIYVLEPTFKPGVLSALVSQNNMLGKCVEAMEVNIDGTGHVIKLVTGEKEDEIEKKKMESFFKEPYPGKSMVEIRRALRRDIEAIGNGYLEVIRDITDEIAMLNWQDAQDMRLLRLGDVVEVDKVLERDGVEVTMRVRVRERRFVQLVNGKSVYFKEFGAHRDIDRDTGEWAKEGERLPINKRGSEIIHIVGNKEPKTPYGSPRWISQLPSVLGSRKSEEHNLDFFDGGGVPPVLVIVQGGTLGREVKEDLKLHLSGSGGKHRAAVVEAISTSGSLESAGTVQVRVERFGAERQQDAMFANYDKNCGENIRTAFRLPQMFIGMSGDLNFATAYTAYMVAEAQVFFPERDEFDTLINTRIVRGMGVKKYVFSSLPVTLVDVQNQLKALEYVREDQTVAKEEIVEILNNITGLTMNYQEPPPPPVEMMGAGAPTSPTAGGVKQPKQPLQLVKQPINAQTTGTGASPPYKVGKLDLEDLDLEVDISGLEQLCACADHLIG
jgi:PBSX family phage portal protein